MDDEREMVLRMLKEGKITVEEADALLQELTEQRADDEAPAASSPPGEAAAADVGQELRTIFQDLVDAIPRDVVRELKQAGEALRPGFLHVVRGLRGLVEGRAEVTAEEVMAAGDEVVLRNAWGDVALGASPDDRLRLRATKRVWAPDEATAQREADALQVEVRRDGRTVEVSVERPMRPHQRARVDLTLAVPSGVDARVDVAKGDVRVDALRGTVDLRVARGDVKLREHAGPARVAVVSGDVSASRLTGAVDVETKSGDIAIGCVRAREARARTLAGDVELSFDDLTEGTVSVETVSGDIDLRLPSSGRASIDAVTRSGSIHSSLPLSERTGDRRSLRGVLNGPGAAVRLSAMSGDIELREHRP